MEMKRFETLFFLLCFGVILYGFYRIFSPFMVPIAWAIILATVFFPLYRRLCGTVGGREGLAALLLLLLICIVIVLPVIWMVVLLAGQSMDLYRSISGQLAAGGDIQQTLKQFKYLSNFLEWSGQWIDWEQMDIKGVFLGFLNNISNFLVSQSSKALGSTAGFVMSFLIMLITLYYLFKDGSRLLAYIKELSPLPKEYEDQLIRQFRDVAYATLYGNILTALCQGAAGALLFLVTGLSASLLWGGVMALLSFIPVVGSFLVWGPAGLYLLATGETTRAMILWIGGAVMVGSIDNVLKPIFIKGKADMHSLLVFFSVFGGMTVFGFIGLMIGPLTAALFLTFLSLWRMEFKEALGHKLPTGEKTLPFPAPGVTSNPD